MKTAYITGGTGCVGRNLINELLIDHWKIIAVHRKSSKLSRLADLDIELREVDLHDFDSVENSLPMDVDAIFHVAANVSHWPFEEKEQWKDNVLATRHLVRAALKKKARRFIFTSTNATSAYPGTTKVEAARIGCQYVRTKRLSELEVQEGMALGLDAIIMKPLVVIGAFDYNNYSQTFTRLNSGTLRVVFPGAIDFCHARDVARAHIRAFEKGRRGESYVLGGPHASWLEVFQKIARLLNIAPPTRQTPRWVLLMISYPILWASYWTRKKPVITPQLVRLLGLATAASVEEARKSKIDLGYQSGSLEEMLQDCYQWLVKEGLLNK